MLFSKGNKTNATKGNAQDPLVAVDIGTSKIRLIAGEVNNNGDVHVLYYNEEPSSGVVNGAVSDLSKLSESLALLVKKYEDDTGNTFSHCIMGIPGRHIESKNERGNATVPTHIVTEVDRDNALEHARSIKFSDLSRILHVIPQAYEIDNSKDIVNPIGLSAMRLGVGVHLIACNEDQENNFKSAIERLSPHFVVDQVIYNGIAASEAVLSKAEKEIGICLVDFGGGTLNVTVYDQGKLILSFGFDFGGSSITRSLATNYGIPISTAEFLKVNHAAAHPNLLTEQDKGMVLAVPVIDGEQDEKIYISRIDLSTIVCQRLIDPFRQIRDRLDCFIRDTNLPITLGGGIVLTGGVALTKGIAHLAAKYIVLGDDSNKKKQKARVGLPRGVSTANPEDIDGLMSPEWATAIGLLRFGHSANKDNSGSKIPNDRKNTGVMSKTFTSIKDWLSREF